MQLRLQCSRLLEMLLVQLVLVAVSIPAIICRYTLFNEPGITYASGMAAVPGTDKFLLIGRVRNTTDGWSPAHDIESSLFDAALGQASPLPRTRHSLFCGGPTILPSGDILVVGGGAASITPTYTYDNGMQMLQVFNRSSLSWGSTYQMRYKRWYGSAGPTPSGKLLIVGGSDNVDNPSNNNAAPVAELWDPSHPNEPTVEVPLSQHFKAGAGFQYYPAVHSLPHGDMLVFGDKVGFVLNMSFVGYLDAESSSNSTSNSSASVSLLDLPLWPSTQGNLTTPAALRTMYPFIGSMLLLPLLPENGYKSELMLFGGNYPRPGAPIPQNLTASPLSFRIGVSVCPTTSTAAANSPAAAATGGQRSTSSSSSDIPSGLGASYCTDGWVVETMMDEPRVMPNSVLLPNGLVVVLNGAQAGIGGGDWNVRAPQFKVLLYDPSAPYGQRYSLLDEATIPRLYHSSACLTPNGTVLVGGCDACGGFNGPNFTAPQDGVEQRMEELVPNFLLDLPRPAVTEAPPDMAYDRPYELRFTMVVPGNSSGGASAARRSRSRATHDLRVVLAAPCADTHSVDNHQRVVGLKINKWLSFQPASGTTPEGGAASPRPPTLYEGRVVVSGPPSSLPGVAPPGWYMLFVVVGKSYSRAAWVVLG